MNTSYDVILSPVITEKSTKLTEVNQVVFRVTLDATKPAIAKAVEGLFKVKVKAVNTVRVKGKKKLFRGRAVRPQRFQESGRDPRRGLPDRHHDGTLIHGAQTIQADDAGPAPVGARRPFAAPQGRARSRR